MSKNNIGVGALVKIREGTDDDRLPKNRIGLVVEVETHHNRYRASELIYHVQFGNGRSLKFFENFIEIISEAQ